MKNKAYIFGWFSFPRGGPNANFVQYLALAMKKIGYETYIVCDDAQVQNCTVNQENKCFSYKDIYVECIRLHATKPLHGIEYRYLRGYFYANRIKKHDPSAQDVFISYCASSSEVEPVFYLAKKCGAKMLACLPEYYTKDVFEDEKAYDNYMDYMNRVVPKHDALLPISNYIRDKYSNSRAMVLPIMADTLEYSWKTEKRDEKVRIIYSTGKWVKDSLTEMIHGIIQLPEKVRNRLELHITGLKYEIVEEMLSEKEKSALNTIIVIHKWLEYRDLVQLYTKMDFVLIARPDTPFFQANFPSKVPEAMTYGVIPIVSRVGDYTKIYLEDGSNSIVFDGCDANSCTKAILRALCLNSIEREYLRKKARETAETLFDYRIWSDKISEFINEI